MQVLPVSIAVLQIERCHSKTYTSTALKFKLTATKWVPVFSRPNLYSGNFHLQQPINTTTAAGKSCPVFSYRKYSEYVQNDHSALNFITMISVGTVILGILTFAICTSFLCQVKITAANRLCFNQNLFPFKKLAVTFRQIDYPRIKFCLSRPKSICSGLKQLRTRYC